MDASFLCPIKQELMVDPVTDKDGHSYEREAIESWIRQHGTSPLTRQPLTISDLRPNRALKDAIQLYLHKKTTLPTGEGEGDINCTMKQSSDYVQVSLTPTKGARQNVDLVCVIDVSGSMKTLLSLTNSSGEKESLNITTLDIVKHAVKTVIASLTPSDRCAIVAFSDEAETMLDLSPMDELGKSQAVKTVEELVPLAATNLWGGVERGFQCLLQKQYSNAAVLLFTDGEPTIIPPRGHLDMLKRLKQKMGELPGSLYCFGFGYSLDSKLLNELSLEGGGQYAFIPDATFVGTVFIHAMSTILDSKFSNVKLLIKTDHPFSIDVDEESSFLFGHRVSVKENEIEMEVGTCLGDTSLDIILPIPNTVKVDITVKSHSTVWKPTLVNDPLETLHIARQLFCSTVQQMMRSVVIGKEAETRINELVDKLSHLNCPELLKDINGQVREAFQENYYNRWGKHYLYSLVSAHLYQICNNFKDPGVQIYKGKLFKELVDYIDDIFMSIPMKIPPPQTYQVYQTCSSNTVATIDLSRLNDPNISCVCGSNYIRLKDGMKLARDIVKGDRLHNGGIVECVVVTNVQASIEMYQVGKLKITGWHPILWNEKWTFPNTVGKKHLEYVDQVFSFLVSNANVILVENVPVITLNHGLMEDPVTRHEFFGTSLVVKSIEKLNGFSKGRVFVNQVKRENGLVVDLI